ncbi:hypothetical protein [Curtobacterium oceanosedimentum]|uniref:hypothetical protein n=1 Tax=Curtobacterium oceanosedimentum TaxID=465820 RepID=UPI001CE16E22|nr:hypothetical protein [Curtobacterium oceanosedimentum]MCA5924704.1 hypothetical protein [Curtobacterium oceanosedimentum]
MFSLGLQVFRRHVTDVLDPARVRRAAAWSGLAAAVALVGMAVLEARVGWTGAPAARSVVAMVLLATGVGLLTFACIPTWRAPDRSTTINGRQVRPSWQWAARPSVQPYLRRRAVPIRPEDRETVRTDTVLLRRGLIGVLARTVPLAAAGAAALVGGVVLGGLPVVWALWPVVYGLQFPDLVVRLGRSERARRAAEALDPLAETPTHTTP